MLTDDELAAVERAINYVMRKDAATLRALADRSRNGGGLVRIDPAQYEDGYYLNPVTGHVIRIEAPPSRQT